MPLPVSCFADSSLLARAVTPCPLLSSSSATLWPMKPEAPVRKICIAQLQSAVAN